MPRASGDSSPRRRPAQHGPAGASRRSPPHARRPKSGAGSVDDAIVGQSSSRAGRGRVERRATASRRPARARPHPRSRTHSRPEPRRNPPTAPNGTIFPRVTVDPRQMGGVPCMRDLRIPVATLVDMVASGMSNGQIVLSYPGLTTEDIAEALRFAAETVREQSLPGRGRR